MSGLAFEDQLGQECSRRGISFDQVQLRDGKGGTLPWLQIGLPAGPYQYRRGRLCIAQVLRPERPGRLLNQMAASVCESRGALRAHLLAAALPAWQGWLANRQNVDAVLQEIPAGLGRLRLHPEHEPGQLEVPGINWHLDASRRTVLRQSCDSLLRDKGVVSIERVSPGRRLFLLCDSQKVLAAQYRSPPELCGDGRRSILQLLVAENASREADRRIKVDDLLLKVLSRQGVVLSDVPDEGRQILIAQIENGRRGYRSEGLAGPVPEALEQLAIRAIRAVPGLFLAAVELQLTEVGQLEDAEGVHIRNVMATPDLQAFAAPDKGTGSDFAAPFLDLLSRPEVAAMDPWELHSPSPMDAEDPTSRGMDSEARAMALDLRKLGIAYQLKDIPGGETGERRCQLEFDFAGYRYSESSGARRMVMENGETVNINTRAIPITSSKPLTKQVLDRAGIGTPQGRSFQRTAVQEAIEFARRLGPDRGQPVCIKPARGIQGILVHTDCRTVDDIETACRAIARRFGEIVVEETIHGEDVRFLYVKPDVVGLQRSVRPSVTGNGRDRLLSLIASLNAKMVQTGRQRDIRADSKLVAFLLADGMRLEDVPAAGQQVILSKVSNNSVPLEGGQRMEDVHSSYIDMARRAFEAIPGLRIAAMDTIITQCDAPAVWDRFKVLEINSSPGVLSHILPVFGPEEQPFTPALLELLRREGDQIAAEAQLVLQERHSEEDDGQIFSEISAALAHQETAFPEEVAEHQFEALLGLLEHARAETPFHEGHLREVLREGKFHPEAWAALPSLGREEVRLLGSQLHSRSTPEGGEISTVTTSGSSGSPLSIRWNRVATISTRAAVQRMYDWHGLDLTASYAGIRSYQQARAAFPGMRHQRSWNDLVPDAPFYALSVDTPIQQQLDWLEMLRPRYLNTYPSLATELAELALARGSDLRFEAILTAGEVLTPRIRALSSQAFGARMIDSYGCQEMGKIAVQCEHPEGGLHICTSNVLVEILDEQGRPVPPGGTGRVVLTSLYNYAMPFIRYDIGDYATLSDRPCACGRSQPVLSQVHGRRRNLVTLPDGDRRWIPGPVLSEMSKAAGARHARLVQTAPDHFELRCVMASAASFDSSDAASEALSRIAARLIHPEVRVSLVPVEALERGASGKFEDVVGLEGNSNV